MPGGTRSVFKRAFRPKRELHFIFLGKKVIIIISIIFLENLRKIDPQIARYY